MRTLNDVKSTANEMSTYNEGMMIVFWNDVVNKGKILYHIFYTSEKNDELKNEGFIPVACFIKGKEYPVINVSSLA